MRDDWRSKVGRRVNDALRANTSDSPFVAEVKRLARARGVSAHELARRIGCHQSEVHRHLRADKERTFAKTADQYAGALDVDKTYLRLLATGEVDESTLPEAQAAVSRFRALFDDALPALDTRRIRELWDAAVAAIAARPAEARRALAIPLRDILRAEVNAKLSIEEKSREPFAVLKESLETLGIDVTPYMATVGAWALADLWIMLQSIIADKDRDDIIALFRDKLKARGLYQRAMDQNLSVTKRDPRAYRPERSAS